MNSANTGARGEIPFPSLVAFEAAARLGSVSRAADELHLTQSAVSQRILKLEAHVGQRLFVRAGHGLRLTGAGELLLATTQQTLARLREGFERIEPYRNKTSLLLACPPGFAHGWLLSRLPRLRALSRGLEVWLMHERDVTEIDRIDVDLLVSTRPRHRADVECVPLLEDAALAVCGPQTAQRLAGAAWPKLLEREPLLFLEAEPAWGGRLTEPGLKPLKLRRAATFDDERLLLAAAEQEQGVAWVSRISAAQALAAGRLVALQAVPPAPRERLWLMRSTLTPRTPLADKAFDLLGAMARE